jgi:hypothetical protein
MPADTAPAWPDPAREAVEWALAVHFTQNRQPCMSGDPRDRLSSLQRRNMEDARDAVLEALAPLVAAREAAAWAAGAEAMKLAAAEAVEHIRNVARYDDAREKLLTALMDLRALPLPPPPAATKGGQGDE